MPISCFSERLSSGLLFRCAQRRRNLRFDIKLPIRVRATGTPWTVGETVDLSASGVFLIMAQPLLRGATVEYVLNFPPELTNSSQPGHVRFSGTVVRSERVPKPRGSFGIAIRNEVS